MVVNRVPATPPTAPWVRLALLILLLVTFGLRAFHLDFQSLWSDEGISLVRSSLPPGTMLAQMPVEHVPGYFLLLHGWMRLVGSHDFALRYLSLLPSVWAVTLIYRLAADLGWPRAGLWAALLLATNGFQVWYAQEARMYSWLLAAGALSALACWRLFTRATGWGTWTVYVLATAATIYLHFFGFLAPLSHTVWAGGWLIWGRSRRVVWRWAAAGVAVALLFAPWGWRTLDLLRFEGWRPPLDPRQVPWLLLHAYSVGETMPDPWGRWLPWLYAGLALMGLAAWLRRARLAGAFLATLLGAAVGMVWLMVVRQPDFHVRYPILISLPLMLLTGGGIAALGGMRRTWGALLPALVGVGLVAANGAALQRLYVDTTLHKPDFRGAAAAINQGVTAADVVLVDGPNPELVFAHYYTGAAPVFDLRDLAGADPAQIEARLAEATQGAVTAWELLYFHTPGPVQHWLAVHGWPAAPSDHNGIRVSQVGLAHAPLPTHALALPFGPALTLTQAGVDGPHAAAGDLVRVTTTWQVQAAPPDYKFSLRLAAPDGSVVIADDYVPVNWFFPTTQWPAGGVVEDRRALSLPRDLPRGRYAITLRLYDPANGIPVETPAGQDVRLAEVDVIP